MTFSSRAAIACALLASCASGTRPNGASVPTPAAPGATSTSGPCHGRDLDVDQVAKACEHERPDESAPGRDALQIELESPARVVSGRSALALVRFRNASPAPLEFQLNATCAAPFDVRILRADGGRADIEEEVGGLGLCGTVPGIRVVLGPGGVLTKRLEVSAVAMRWVPIEPGREEPLELAPGSPIAPAKYTLEVALPLYTDNKRGWQARTSLRAPLEIVSK